MAYAISEYQGDSTHTINCTGDSVVGDEVSFECATFTGSFRSAKFAGFERITGTIIRDSYGRDKQQHTFTLLLEDGEEMRIKGRNLYKNGTWRKPWADESQRKTAAAEKHQRGDVARQTRAVRQGNEAMFGYA